MKTKYTYKSKCLRAATVNGGWNVRIIRGQRLGRAYGNWYYRWRAEVRGPDGFYSSFAVHASISAKAAVTFARTEADTATGAATVGSPSSGLKPDQELE